MLMVLNEPPFEYDISLLTVIFLFQCQFGFLYQTLFDSAGKKKKKSVLWQLHGSTITASNKDIVELNIN